MNNKIIVEIDIDSTQKQEKSSEQISKLRQQIDQIDKNILELISQRFHVIDEIGVEKEKLNIPIVQSARWEEVLNDKITQAKKLHLPAELVVEIRNILHTYSIAHQQRS